MANEKVIVRRNTDDRVLNSLFGDQIIAAAESSRVVGNEIFADEPWDYIPPAGTSTRRGSRMVRTMEGSPFGSPSEIVDREIMRNPQYRGADLRDIRPLAITQVNPSNIVNKVGDFGPSVPPPTQKDCIPEEYKKLMPQPQPVTEALPIEPTEIGGPTMITSQIKHPRQFVTEDIPSANPAPDMRPPVAPGHILPPAEPEKPHKITEDMIVKVGGYNETNMYLLTEVSKNVAYCGNVIAKLNNASKPVNMNEVMSLLSYMDNEEFRKLLVGTFTTIMQNNMQLSTTITKYLNGELPAEEEEQPAEETTEPQDTAGDSASSGDGEDSSTPSIG